MRMTAAQNTSTNHPPVSFDFFMILIINVLTKTENPLQRFLQEEIEKRLLKHRGRADPEIVPGPV
jgi:hypothetical protein